VAVGTTLCVTDADGLEVAIHHVFAMASRALPLLEGVLRGVRTNGFKRPLLASRNRPHSLLDTSQQPRGRLGLRVGTVVDAATGECVDVLDRVSKLHQV